ncbi:SprT-like family-domain-containing protein [Dactylonectria estremocensis]|uniref:SprT-like family-domain-containing protein n=1 Tax=Dactylonectria estremocensis TaxID=1079267 RepID=A0A9P9E0T8_9HYPO|nr:SprT-like family-domain-containing protein [Dactylonectria estremocensis]
MARLADLCPSSDDDLPDLKTLLRKPSTRATREADPSPKNEAKSLTTKPTSKSGTRRVRRLGESSQAAANPLFQKWSSQAPASPLVCSGTKATESRRRARQVPEVETTKSSLSNSEVESEEDDEPPSRARRIQMRRPQIVEDSDDDADQVSCSDHETLLSRVRNLQRTRSSAMPGTKLDNKPPVSKIVKEGGSKASQMAKDLDRSETEELVENGEAEDPSVYQTAEEESSELSSAFNSDTDGSPFRPQRKRVTKPALGKSRNPSRVKSNATSMKNAPALEPPNVGRRKLTTGLAGEALRSDREVGARAISQTRTVSQEYKKDGRSKTSTTKSTSSDLADSLSKLRLHLQDFSDEESITVKQDKYTTPPSTPPRASKAQGLKSPTKRNQIPETPHGPSMDAFWSQDLVNDWNDQHSPRKLILPPAAKSPSKSSPKKAPKAETKKAFGARKHALAERFLGELDREITQGKVAELAESTGGVKLVWSKTLNTTAGRASWRRETIRTRQADGTQVSVQYKHHASIELAEKVIDDDHRLLNVLAHEFCHLANFMISGITNNPHGKEFKIWAAQCSRTFADRGIVVTTKHSYDIDFKYVWECEACTTEFKRHSKSIDPERHRCGSCKGMLRQTKPVPRKGGKATSQYQVFFKEQMAIVREENPGSPQKDVMKLIAAKWAKQGGSSKTGKGSKATVDNMVEKMVDLTLEEEV